MKCCKIFNFSSLILQLLITNNIFRSENTEIRSENVENRNLNFKSFSDRKIRKNRKTGNFSFPEQSEKWFSDGKLIPDPEYVAKRAATRGQFCREKFFSSFSLCSLARSSSVAWDERAPSRRRRRRRQLRRLRRRRLWVGSVKRSLVWAVFSPKFRIPNFFSGTCMET